jgi:hypothetical protein
MLKTGFERHSIRVGVLAEIGALPAAVKHPMPRSTQTTRPKLDHGLVDEFASFDSRLRPDG